MQLTGIHHLTAITADAKGNRAFFTDTLGLRLVKKTVNQDDVSAYHLFYADGRATPGTDVTFFDWPIERERRGTHSITRTGLRVASEASLAWWADRLKERGVKQSAIASEPGPPVRVSVVGATNETCTPCPADPNRTLELAGVGHLDGAGRLASADIFPMPRLEGVVDEAEPACIGD